MARFSELVQQLRGRVVAALHAGHLHPGDRLPSVRALAEELGEDPRTILRAYRSLEQEGLVEIRRRSGIYLASQEQVAPEIGWETSRWLVEEVLAQAWQRRIRVPDLPDFIRRCTETVTVRCACIDAVEDVRAAHCQEIREDFGMATTPVPLRLPGDTGSGRRRTRLRGVLNRADLLVTSSFHAAELRPLAKQLGLPLVVMTLNPLAREQIERLLPGGPLTFVVLDPAFEERLRLVFGENLRVVLASDRKAVKEVAGSGRVVLSRAAAERLRDRGIPTSLNPQTPLISADTARELAHWLVHFNLQALRSGKEESRGR